MNAPSTPEAPSSLQSTPTEGHTIGWANAYDRTLGWMTLGRERVWRGRMVDAAMLSAGERVLDVGCGTGTLALRAAERVGTTGRVVGIDPSAEMIARARAKAASSGLVDRVRFETAAIEQLPFEDHSFDVVTGSLMFHHLPPQVQHAGLSEIRRVLAPGGRLVIVDFPGRGPLLHRLLGSLRLPHRHQGHRAHADHADHAATHEGFSMDKVVQQAKQRGFDDVQVTPFRPSFLTVLTARAPSAT